MGKTTPYSDRENKILLNDLLSNNNIITREHIDSLAALWEGLTGRARNAHNLGQQTIKMAKKLLIPYQIESLPKRDTSNWKKPDKAPSRITAKSRMKEQILYIIQAEIKNATIKATTRILNLVEETIRENVECKEELRSLRGYKQIVETSYSKELSMRGGN
jgi:hypothetical protein